MGSKKPGGLWSLIWHIRTDWWHVFNSKLLRGRVELWPVRYNGV